MMRHTDRGDNVYHTASGARTRNASCEPRGCDVSCGAAYISAFLGDSLLPTVNQLVSYA